MIHALVFVTQCRFVVTGSIPVPLKTSQRRNPCHLPVPFLQDVLGQLQNVLSGRNNTGPEHHHLSNLTHSPALSGQYLTSKRLLLQEDSGQENTMVNFLDLQMLSPVHTLLTCLCAGQVHRHAGSSRPNLQQKQRPQGV